MMEFATERIAALGGKRISIGLIDSHNVLKSWYADQGYVQTAVRNFAHLPFEGVPDGEKAYRSCEKIMSKANCTA